MELLNLPRYFFRLKEQNGKKYIFDEVRRRFVLLTPEEWVRQNMVRFLVDDRQYPQALISVEKAFSQFRRRNRYDLLIHDRSGEPLMIVECKAPGVEITQQVFDQATRYNISQKARYMLITNGIKHYCCQMNPGSQQYSFLQEIPEYMELA